MGIRPDQIKNNCAKRTCPCTKWRRSNVYLKTSSTFLSKFKSTFRKFKLDTTKGKLCVS